MLSIFYATIRNTSCLHTYLELSIANFTGRAIFCKHQASLILKILYCGTLSFNIGDINNRVNSGFYRENIDAKHLSFYGLSIIKMNDILLVIQHKKELYTVKLKIVRFKNIICHSIQAKQQQQYFGQKIYLYNHFFNLRLHQYVVLDISKNFTLIFHVFLQIIMANVTCSLGIFLFFHKFTFSSTRWLIINWTHFYKTRLLRNL